MKPIIFSLLCLIQYAFAQGPSSQPLLQLQDAINIALRNSYDIQLAKNDIQFIAAKNPYWNQNGKMFTDPDGFRIIVSPQKIKS